MKTQIKIGGDFCITPSYVSKNLFTDEFVNFFINSDLNIVNLECPIIREGEVKLTIIGPHLSTTEEVCNQLRKINVHAVTLANNHILDYGEKGLETTFESCIRNNLLYVGAGKELSDASKPLVIETNGIRVGIVNFCENEWSVATEKSAGANPLDLIDNLKQIKLTREIADFVLVIIHGGHEFYNLPSPRMLKTYRFFAENGADAIIGHHSHCISGFEWHKNVPIFYGLGNMLFTEPEKSEEWYKGIILQLTLEIGKPISFELHPILQSKSDYKLTLLENTQKEKVLSEIKDYSDTISNRSELQRKWEQFVVSKKRDINIFSPLNFVPGKYVQAALFRLGINKIVMSKQGLAKILNHIRCEAHRDITLSLINNTIIKK
jgi:poly-gamma-glutamate capsule biosynthesis protein CapA/YwtB (metallophosphatase superfamily)